MTHFLILLILAGFALYSLVSQGLKKTPVTLPIIFTLLGLAMSAPLSAGTDPQIMHDGKRILAEVTLILVLFADASHVRFHKLSKHWRLPARMLLVGMPLTIGIGALVAYGLNPTSGFAMAVLTAAVLTPTDAALGQSVVSSEDVPEHLSQTINVESGLNDGLVLPVILFGALLASAGASEHIETGDLMGEALREIALGPIAGIAIGWAMARLLDWCQDRRWINESASGVVFLCSAFMAYVFAVMIGGNGFIAAFVAGMTFGNVYRHDIHFISEFMEGAGQLLTMSAFFVFGAFLLSEGLRHAQFETVVLALLFLTAVRMVPIFVSLAGAGLSVKEKLFLGWFGPRGLASILFTLIMIDQFEFPDEAELLACVSLTVGLSILLHGISAAPLAKRIGGIAERQVEHEKTLEKHRKIR